MSLVHRAPSPETSDVDDLLAELERDLKPEKKARAPRAAVVHAWNNLPTVTVTWTPAAVALVVNTQRCRCGCEAQSVEGLFLEDHTRNGATRQQRHERGPLPADYVALPRILRERIQQIEMCPACFEAGTVMFEPAAATQGV